MPWTMFQFVSCSRWVHTKELHLVFFELQRKVLSPLSSHAVGKGRHRVEVCPIKALDLLLWGGGHRAPALQHHPHTKVPLLHHEVDLHALLWTVSEDLEGTSPICQGEQFSIPLLLPFSSSSFSFFLLLLLLPSLQPLYFVVLLCNSLLPLWPRPCHRPWPWPWTWPQPWPWPWPWPPEKGDAGQWERPQVPDHHEEPSAPLCHSGWIFSQTDHIIIMVRSKERRRTRESLKMT